MYTMLGEEDRLTCSRSNWVVSEEGQRNVMTYFVLNSNKFPDPIDKEENRYFGGAVGGEQRM